MFSFLLFAALSVHLLCAMPQTEEKELVHIRSLIHDLKEDLQRSEERKQRRDEAGDGELHPNIQQKREEAGDGELHPDSPNKRELSRRSSGTLSASEQQEYVDAHNEFRRQTSPEGSNIRFVKWNDDLAAIAAEWAEGCSWSHNGERTSKQSTFGYVGENKYINSGNKKIHRSVEYWNLEGSKYDFDTQACSSGICTHYTQVVWHNSEYIGCGVAYCSSFSGLSGWSGYYHVCNYGPGGNYVGQDPYTSGSACSGCTDDCCNNDLCVPIR